MIIEEVKRPKLEEKLTSWMPSYAVMVMTALGANITDQIMSNNTKIIKLSNKGINCKCKIAFRCAITCMINVSLIYFFYGRIVDTLGDGWNWAMEDAPSGLQLGFNHIYISYDALSYLVLENCMAITLFIMALLSVLATFILVSPPWLYKYALCLPDMQKKKIGKWALLQIIFYCVAIIILCYLTVEIISHCLAMAETEFITYSYLRIHLFSSYVVSILLLGINCFFIVHILKRVIGIK